MPSDARSFAELTRRPSNTQIPPRMFTAPSDFAELTRRPSNTQIPPRMSTAPSDFAELTRRPSNTQIPPHMSTAPSDARSFTALARQPSNVHISQDKDTQLANLTQRMNYRSALSVRHIHRYLTQPLLDGEDTVLLLKRLERQLEALPLDTLTYVCLDLAPDQLPRKPNKAQLKKILIDWVRSLYRVL